ncbi:MAG: BlaI/MecI/CopY family transcriptional regulator [Candidatus Eremiobacteraeota bacterium]|nr:BlaI/MecI/CopY family transcriptional regulator [Candidatus Eremiobacteraeota bacterium]
MFRLDGKGSGLALGPLEAKVMDVIWSREGWVSVSDIHHALTKGKSDFAYSTIKTVMTNLAEKAHLQKRSAGRANEFKAVQTREAFEESVVGDVLRPLVRNYRNPLLAHIIDQLNDDGDVAELERLLALKKVEQRRA